MLSQYNIDGSSEAYSPHIIAGQFTGLLHVLFSSGFWKEMAGATVPDGPLLCLAGDASRVWQTWQDTVKTAEVSGNCADT